MTSPDTDTDMLHDIEPHDLPVGAPVPTPFDRALYDAVMVEAIPNMVHGFDKGYETGAKVAAWIAAERVPVSDEELISRVANALGIWTDPFTRKPTSIDTARIVLAIDVVRAAIAPAGPVIPEDWRLRHIVSAGSTYRAVLDWDKWTSVSAVATNPTDALNAAIAAAKEGEG